MLRDEPSSPDDPTDFFPMTTSMTRELRLELESLDRQVFGPSPPSELQCDCVLSKKESDLVESETDTELARCSPAADVFVWENPLHTLQQKHHPTTPDEQAELEYDGEILEDQNGVKSVTPIRLLKRTTRYMRVFLIVEIRRFKASVISVTEIENSLACHFELYRALMSGSSFF